MTQAAKIIIITPVLALIGVVISLIMPTLEGYQGSWLSFHLPLALSIFFAELFVGAALIFLLNLKVYTQYFAHAYQLIAASISLNAVGALLVLLIVAYNWRYEDWAMIIIGMPFFISGIIGYLGALTLGKIVKYHAPVWGTPAAFMILLAVSFIVIIVPHAKIPLEETIIDTSNLIFMLGGMLNLMAGLIIRHISKGIGTHYTAAMAWLSLGFILGAIAVITAVIHDLSSSVNRDAVLVIIECVTIASAVVFMKAGYVFAQLRRL